MEGNFFCALCLDVTSDSADEDYFVSTECGHIFHYMCIKPSYEHGFNDCPICKQRLNMNKLRKLFGIEVKPKVEFSLTPSAPQNDEPFEFDQKFKIIIVGCSGVGKSCLMQRYADGTYSTNVFSTVGCDWRSKTVNIGGKVVSLSIWDTVGQERHRSLITNYVRDAHGALIVYDITKEDTFEEIEYWYSFVKNFGLHDCVKILVGNKTDLEQHREVPKVNGKATAQKLGVPFFETSAKDAYNVEAVFRTLAATILENDGLVKEIEAKKRHPTLRITKDQQDTSVSSAICSYSWYWTRSGFAGMVKSIKSGWNFVTTSRNDGQL